MRRPDHASSVLIRLIAAEVEICVQELGRLDSLQADPDVLSSYGVVLLLPSLVALVPAHVLLSALGCGRRTKLVHKRGPGHPLPVERLEDAAAAARIHLAHLPHIRQRHAGHYFDSLRAPLRHELLIDERDLLAPLWRLLLFDWRRLCLLWRLDLLFGRSAGGGEQFFFVHGGLSLPHGELECGL